MLLSSLLIVINCGEVTCLSCRTAISTDVMLQLTNDRVVHASFNYQRSSLALKNKVSPSCTG